MALLRRLDLSDATVLLTGAAGGIGAAGARELVGRGARVALVDLPSPGLDALAAELGDRARALPGDVTDAASMRAVVEAVIEWTGRLDVVWANAGISAEPPTTMRLIDEAQFDRVIDVNLLGVWRTIRPALPAIVEARGHVVITASIYAFANGLVNAPYAASKAAVESLGRSLRAELAGMGATVGVLYPGWIETPIVRSSRHEDAVAVELTSIGFPGPFGTLVTPEALAAAAVRGSRRRAARTIHPRAWIGWSWLRGVISPMVDLGIDHHRRVQRLVRELESQRERGS